MKRIIGFVCLILALILMLGSCTTGSDDLDSSAMDTTKINEATGSSSDEQSNDSSFAEETEADPYEIIELPKPESDPYATVSEEEFYADYKPAESYWDAFYRTQHGFMSGSLDEQDQEPSVSDNRPKGNGVFLRNSFSLYSYDGRAYTVLDSDGEIAFTVYEGGGYVTLEEVAAYVFAFGNIPANYVEKKSGNPSSSRWGKYLRLNHSAFSGSTSKYPYEPELPDISGCGGDLYYYEIDIGTTGTDCDPSYRAEPYNNGSKITRGAARIVYSRYDANKNNIIDINEKYLFYTYNHYNDFQEYLNYEGGWGEMFGNITGGGVISSKVYYNPTPYPKTQLKDFREFKNTAQSSGYFAVIALPAVDYELYFDCYIKKEI